MRVRVLGVLEVENGNEVISVGGPQARRLVARLALDAGRLVSVDALAEAAWGDDQPATARHTIATQVLRLRRAGLHIDTAPDGYVLRTPTDVADLERLTARAQATRVPRRAARAYRRALDLWRGEPFPELLDVADRMPVAARLDDQIATLREEWLSAELDSSEAPQWISASNDLTVDHPYRERGWELLMLALYRSGRQAEALDAYANARRRLVDDLGIEPGIGLRQMQLAVLAQDAWLTAAPSDASASAPPQPAPPAIPATSTRLIGREHEQHELSEVWARTRLATLVGPPGAGKTRLAVDAATHIGGAVWYVAIEQLPSGQTVAAAILDLVDPSSRAIDAAQGARDALAPADGLLVLDGCEVRKDEIVRLVDRLLHASPALRILATSRARLGLGDEAILRVGPLPADDARSLLIDRARLVDPAFAIVGPDAEAADRLCSLVDHLPLGIELVASHLHLLGVQDMVDRVEADLARWVGRSSSGRGLWVALDASGDELAPAERDMLTALAVMVGDADLDLVAAVANAPESDAFDSLAVLVDLSLVHVRSGAGRGRYELLRTVAVHTLDRASSADVARARARYEHTVLHRATELARELASSDRRGAMQRLDREMPHVRAVLGAIAGGAPDERSTNAGLEVAVALYDYWLGRHPAEGADWIRRLLDGADASDELRAQACLLQGHLLYWLTDFDNATTIVEEARSRFAGIGDALGEGRALRRLGAIASATDDVVRARELLQASLDRFEAAGVESEIGTTLLHLGSLLADEGDVVPASAALERALAIAIAAGDPLAEGHALAGLTLAHWKADDLRAARRCGDRALARFRDLGHLPTEGTVAYRLAAVTRGLGHPHVARRHAHTAIRAGEQSSTRTTVAFGHINLARLDLDAGDTDAAHRNLESALDALDPTADRWVLVDALEAVARLLVVVGTAGAGQLLDDTAALRADIRQPVSPTERADVDTTRARAGAERRVDMGRTDAAAAYATALQYLYESADHTDEPIPIRSALI
jgi:DNA-binding SARP family transcriptional activator/predicted ATPase